MEKKIKTLRIILMIGTIILLIAGISFLFVSSVGPWVRTITMALISGVLLFLSLYEEFIMKFKKDSIVSYIFGNISIVITYLCITGYELLGEWFTLDGDGAMIYLAGLFTLFALLVLISAVKYKVYKLIELCIWLILIAIAFILKFFELDGIFIYTMIISVILIKNLINTSGYSKWATFAILLFGIGFCGVENHEIMTKVVGALILINMLVVFFRGKGFKAPFVIMMGIYLPIMAHTCFTPFVGLLIIVFLDLLLVGTKVFRKEGKVSPSYVFLKIFVQVAYLFTILFANIEGAFLFIVPTIVFLTSIIGATLLKDDGEKYLLPFKTFYFAYAIPYNIGFQFMKDYMALFIANIIILLLYLLTSNKVHRGTSIAMLVFINLFAIFTAMESVVGTIVMTILFGMDFYIVYVKEEKLKVLTTLLFILQGLMAIIIRNAFCPETLVALALLYGLFICITIKNKVLFASCLFGFVTCVTLYLKHLGIDSIYVGLIANTLIFLALLVYQFVCVETEKSRALFLGLTVGFHIIVLLLTPHNVLLKVFALVESIILLLFSIKNDEHKGLFDVGMVGVVASLLFILGTFESLPKSLYLIIVAMSIIIITPILITRYIRKQKLEALNKPQEEEKKEEEKVEEKTLKKRSIKAKFCPECGSELLPGSAFCSNCGTNIK